MIPSKDLKRKAAEIRLAAMEAALKAGKGHVPPAFSWADVAVALYHGGILRVHPDDPQWPDRDRFILSKGHACLTLYAVLADLGFFGKDELERFAGHGSLLPGHPDFLIPGVDAMSGSLGHGLGVAAGLVMAARLDGKDWRAFVVLGDGECHEGAIWEAAMFAGHQKLDRLVAIVDRNRLAATDFTDNIVTLDPFVERWHSFGWDCLSIDGHSFPEILDALAPRPAATRPLAVICNTVKGKGVSFMENSPKWHHQLPKGPQVEEALAQLRRAVDAWPENRAGPRIASGVRR